MPSSIDKLIAHAGVARATFYRALADHPSVSEETRARVLKAVQALGYPRPRGKNRRRGGPVLWLPGINRSVAGPVAKEMVDALENILARRRHAVRIISHPLPSAPEDIPIDLLREDPEMVFTLALYSDRRLELLARHWPVVSLLLTRQVPGVLSISPDYANAARLAVEHLVGFGHSRIALVIGEVSERNFSRWFLEGYTAAMHLAVPAPDPRLIHSHQDNAQASETPEVPGRKAAEDLLALSEPPTAIIARHDSLAGIMSVIADRGLQVGADISIVGCGGEAMPEAFTPRLSAVCYSCRGQVDAALSAIGSLPEAGMHVIAPVELRPGDSVSRNAAG
ncbi:LacI family DNA-binding transcriptional regulator [Planctomycetota bacterium]